MRPREPGKQRAGWLCRQHRSWAPLLPAGGRMSAAASARAAGAGFCLLGTWQGARDTMRWPQKRRRGVFWGWGSVPQAPGARGAGVGRGGGTTLGVAGAAWPALRGSFPYKEFGWGPSSPCRSPPPASFSGRPSSAGAAAPPAPAAAPAHPGERGSFSVSGCQGRRMSSMFGKPRAGGERLPQSPLAECNVAILGCRGAGKSALTVKFLTKRFISEYDPNLEDTYASEELVDQQPVLLKVMDTADQDGPGNCERYLRWASAFLVVYSIDDRKSFEGCQHYLEVLALHARGCQRRCPVLLLGNKLDMEQYRQVPAAEGMSLASRFGCLFYEVSACQDFVGVQHVFHEAVREVRRQAEWSLPVQPLFITEERPCPSVATPVVLPTRHSLASCTFNTLSTVNYKEIPSVAQAKLVTVKSSRAQSKRKAPTLTLLKGFKIF
ncbi:ras-like protein family member 12 isoform X1 [Falco rusticolus]|uniref:ras-like protein family member 12 isoform X1 n=1 Tax=Falco rusticolus TaxID=120794 RepID=UPI0018865C8F|nr:ras-like protein family member 12 isoform X1 [Falco rusticolus]